MKNFIVLSVFSLVFIGCGGGWTPEQKEELMSDCPKSSIDQCKCGVEILKNEFTYDEYQKLRTMGADVDQDLMNRALDIEQVLESSCGN